LPVPSLKADFDELIRRVQAGRDFAHASFEPIFYLVFPPSQLLEVKRLMPAWTSKLANSGWQVETFSIAEHVAEILRTAPLRKVWIEADRKAPLVGADECLAGQRADVSESAPIPAGGTPLRWPFFLL
jgi:hypothetical protein